MKKLIKGVVAVALAITFVFGVPMIVGKGDLFQQDIVAEASTCCSQKCSHNYRHYYVNDPWELYWTHSSVTGMILSWGKYRNVYSVCSYCGKKEYVRTEYTGGGF